MSDELKRHDADDRDSSDGTGPYTGRSEEPLDMPSAGPDHRPPLWAPWYGIGFVQAMARFVRKALVFDGRASRREYWWVRLVLLVFVACCGVGALLYDGEGYGAEAPFDWTGTPFDMVVVGAYTLWFVPELSLSVRRLHDANLRGWWVVLPTVMQLGALLVGGSTAIASSAQALSVQTMAIAQLALLALLLFATLLEVVLMVLPSDPRGVRFDKPLP